MTGKLPLVNQIKVALFIRLRADLLEGDFRLLYLSWLKAMTYYGVPDDDEEV